VVLLSDWFANLGTWVDISTHEQQLFAYVALEEYTTTAAAAAVAAAAAATTTTTTTTTTATATATTNNSNNNNGIVPFRLFSLERWVVLVAE